MNIDNPTVMTTSGSTDQFVVFGLMNYMNEE